MYSITTLANVAGLDILNENAFLIVPAENAIRKIIRNAENRSPNSL